MWQIILAISIIFLLIEIFVPSIFFLNFAFAGFICAIISVFYTNIYVLIFIFCVLSIALLFTLRPVLLKKINGKKIETGIQSTYIGKTAKVIEKIDKNSGVVSIYDERWQARCDEGTINAGETVQIIGHEGLIFKVQKTN